MQTQWFAECLDCARPHTFTRELKSDRCVGCGGFLVAVGGLLSKKETLIKEFRGKYRFLSNFWPCIVRYDGITYPSVEHAYQASKFPEPEQRATIAALSRPGLAKRAGRGRDRPPDAEDLMHALVRIKFKDRELRDMLLATGDAQIQEGNMWKDTYWGVDLESGVGDNRLGKILMRVRKDCQRDQ